MQCNGSQRGDKKALVTPLVTEFGRHNRPIKPELWHPQSKKFSAYLLDGVPLL